MITKFEVNGNKDMLKKFYFKLENEDMLKMLANSHPKIDKVVRGALCKKFVEKLGLFLGRETTLEEAHALCKRVG